ncbi:MAG: pyruvate carboxylase [Betaproteobacteria bacterium]|jgi:oxaloacetate decarboxylase alpha subunit|nr:pyruvate carboxylase [Rhodocyclaceae bacterium]MCA3145508.1 pyruvate carboxylase [Rhodocyclaceae bacterium]
MAHVRIIDQTMRDGQQSLWGMQMRAGMALPVTPLIDRTGYDVVDLVGSSMFEIMVRNFAEDPWQGLDLIVQSMPRSRIRAGLRNTGLISMSVAPRCLVDLWVETLCAHGVRSFWIYDVLHWNVDKTHRIARVAKRWEAEVVAALMYTLSPVHTDEFYAAKAALLAASPDVDRLIIYDTAGVLTPARARTLIPAVQANCNGKTLEIHSHNVIGIAPLTYLEAISLGVDVIHTCSRPLANGPSLPSVETTLRNLKLAGHTHDLDTSLLGPVADHFEQVGRSAGFAIGSMNEYDQWVFEHQVPGGMTGTLKNQLAQHGMAHRLDEVLREVAAVRCDLGYPGMATPFSQLVGVLAVMNVVNGERYRTIPDEVIQYACGWYGQPVAPIQADVLDRIMAAPRAAEIAASPPPEPSLEELRQRFGGASDEELLLRYMIAEPFIQKMKAAGPVPRDHPLMSSPALEQARALMDAGTARHLEVRAAGLSITLSR